MTDTTVIVDGFNHLRLKRAKEEFLRQQGDTNALGLCFEDRLSLIVDAEVGQRHANRVERKIREAQFKVKADPTDISFEYGRQLVKNKILSLLNSSFIDLKQNVIITGPTGTGKSYLSCTIGVSGCEKEYSVKYFKLSHLQEKLGISRLDGSYHKFSLKLKTYDLLIIDDFGLSPIGVANSREILDILDDRVSFKSTIIASQIPSENWHTVIEDQTAADAIIDRLIHDSIIIDLQGESYRKIKANQNPKIEQ